MLGAGSKVYRCAVCERSFDNKSASLKLFMRNRAPGVELTPSCGRATPLFSGVIVKVLNHIADRLQAVEAIRLEATIKVGYQRFSL